MGAPGIPILGNTAKNSAQWVDIPVFNQMMPREQPKTLPINFDFSVAASYYIDLTNVQQTAKISIIQAMFVDNSANGDDADFQFAVSNQIIKVPAGNQCYVMVIAPNPVKLWATSSGGVLVPVQFLNFPITNVFWKP
jgi:hypothetical protein